MKAVCCELSKLSRHGVIAPRADCRSSRSITHGLFVKETHGMKILALDLGKFKTVACHYEDGQHHFETLQTETQIFRLTIERAHADVVVFETCTAAGWLADLCEELEQPFFVANPSGEAWKWSSIKRKTDRDDALKLARLTAMNELPTVHVSSRAVRAKRSLLRTRQAIVSRRVKIQNEIRALWQSQGFLPFKSGKTGWTKAQRGTLREQTLPLVECGDEELWRGQLLLLLDGLEYAFAQEKILERKLEQMAKANRAVQRLLSIPGVGRCTAEVIAAYLDEPKRFRNGRKVSSYAGLVPRQYQSGNSDRCGRITKRGSKMLRRAVVECAWLLIRYNPWAKELFDRLTGGQKTRRKQAAVAVGRRLLVRCWAMLRDDVNWNGPPKFAAEPTQPATVM